MLEVGKCYYIKQKTAPKKRDHAFCSEYYPFGGKYVKVRVTHAYQRYYVMLVLPRRSVWGVSKPYKVTVQKIDLALGNIKVRKDNGE